MKSALILALILVTGCTAATPAQSAGARTAKPTDGALQCPSVLTEDLAGNNGEEKFAFRDSSGQLHVRQILTEKEKSGRTLLLIMEEGASTTLPKIIFRQSFKRAELGTMNLIVQGAHEPTLREAQRPLTITNNPLWPIDHPWTQKDEDGYAQWIAANADPNILAGGGVNVDCADFAITLRWIYAHDHHLPAAQTLATGGTLFGSWQSTADWDALPTNANWRKDERFKAALGYLLSATYTHSLHKDLYPIAIDNANVAPGSIFLSLVNETGHTQTIYNVGTGGACEDSKFCISTVWGNEPASERGFTSELVPWRLDEKDGGFMRFRWPEKTAAGWTLRDGKQMPGFSEEQYSWDDAQYLYEVSSRLGLWDNPEQRYAAEADALASTLNDRLKVTERGYFLCSVIPCTTNDPFYVEWSTPSRDTRLKNAIKNFQRDGSGVDPSSYTVDQIKTKYGKALFTGAPYSVWDLWQGTMSAGFSSDPTADFAARWNVTSPTLEQQLQWLTQIMADNWAWREDMVMDGLAACYPNGGGKPTCDVCDPKIKALSTQRLDDAFRKVQTDFLALYKKAGDQVQQEISDLLNQSATAEDCGSNAKCTLYDYLFNFPQRWQKMSGDPSAPALSRFGM